MTSFNEPLFTDRKKHVKFRCKLFAYPTTKKEYRTDSHVELKFKIRIDTRFI